MGAGPWKKCPLLRPHVPHPLRLRSVVDDDDGIREAVEEPLPRPAHRDPSDEAVEGEEEGLPEGLDGCPGEVYLLALHVGDLQAHGHLPEGLPPGSLQDRPVCEEDEGSVGEAPLEGGTGGKPRHDGGEGTRNTDDEVHEDPHQDYVDQPGSEPPLPGGDPNHPLLSVSSIHQISPPEAHIPPSVDPLVVHPRAVEPEVVGVLVLEEYVVVPGVGLVGLVLLPPLLAAALAGK